MDLPTVDKNVSLLNGPTATGTTVINSTHIDTTDKPVVTFLTEIGTTNAGNNVRVQGGNAADDSDMADIAGSKITPTGAGPSAVMIDVARSPFKYLRLQFTRAGATTTIGDIWAIGKNNISPVTNAGAAAFPLQLIDPVAGIA